MEALRSDPRRSWWTCGPMPEWQFVGLPDLSAAGKQAVLIPWQVYPTMQHNDGFVDQLRQAGFTAEHHIYFLCRSGQRSLAAAQAAQNAGFPHLYNIADGFEGVVDAEGHRGVQWMEGGRIALAATLTVRGALAESRTACGVWRQLAFNTEESKAKGRGECTDEDKNGASREAHRFPSPCPPWPSPLLPPC